MPVSAGVRILQVYYQRYSQTGDCNQNEYGFVLQLRIRSMVNRYT